MVASFRLIDYSLRPAKFAERRMLCEIFSRLRSFASLESYQYVGFGSIWYADCVLFHRSLGLGHLVSIEREVQYKDRFEFNLPYGNIDLKFGEAAQFLTGLNWGQRLIVWLDYDDPLSPPILDDVRTVFSRACSGTAFAVSVQVQRLCDKRQIYDEPKAIETGADLAGYFGSERTPSGIEPRDLRGWGVAKTARRMILQEIEEGLRIANVGRRSSQFLQFRQVAAFEYADGAKMTTIVGMIVDQGQNGVFESCNFGDLPFYGTCEKDTVRISVPLLTPKEMRHMDTRLPLYGESGESFHPIPGADARRYAMLYRYWPNFASFEP